MSADTLTELVCPAHRIPLEPEPVAPIAAAKALRCASGCRFPVIGGVPRFVPAENYAGAFGRQWNRFRRTQLDSYTGTTVSRDRLTRCLGGDLGRVAGKLVLEAGCGAGRFTEVLLDAGARVFSCDLSSAVDANLANCGRERHFVVQADLRALPVRDEAFDIVICIGVVQHTPDPEATIRALGRYVRPGGLLVIDHYSLDYPYHGARRLLRPLLLRLPSAWTTPATLALCRGLLSFHRRYWRADPAAARMRARLARWSPLVDYFDAYPQLRREVLEEWCVLDTHDTLTDVYKHLRSPAQVRAALEAAGLEVDDVAEAGNGIEARARKPAG